MVLQLEELISLLRQTVNITASESGLEDSAYLSMSDDELTLFLKLAVSKAYPSVDSLDDLPNGSGYPLVLLAKKELYLKLAVSSAPLIDLTADNNNQLKRSQRFEHYMKLAENAQSEYEDWVANGEDVDPDTGLTGVRSYNTYRSKDHYSNRNHELGLKPVVKLKVVEVTNNSASFTWSSFNNSHFGRYKVYVSPNPIVDMFADGTKAESKVLSGSTLVKSSDDYRDTQHRIEGLLPDHEYHVAVFSIERNQLFGVKEVTFRTLPPFEDEEEVILSDFGGR